jgi:hypothetical protein
MIGRSSALVVATCVVAACLFSTSGMGCASFHFEPELPMRARSGDTTLTLEMLRVEWSRRFVYEASSETQHAIANAWFTVPTRVPCGGGARSVEVTVDGGATAVLPPGKHELTVRFPRSYGHREATFGLVDMGFDDFDVDAVIDLETTDGLCLRAPAVSRSVRMTAANRTFLVIDSVAQGGPSNGNVQGLFDVALGVGRWMGPVLTSATVGFGAVIAGNETSKDGRYHPTGKAIPFTLDLRYDFTGVGVSPGHQMNIGLVGLRYSNVWAAMSGSSSHPHLDVHVIQGVLSWAEGPHPLGPFHHGERGTLQELSFPVGVVVDPTLPQSVAFIGGMEMRLLLPL